MTTAVKSGLIALIVAGTLLSPTDLSSCGPFFRTAVFSLTSQPEVPLTSQVGILRPSFPRLYLYQAYRQLTTPLTPEETRALSSPIRESVDSTEEWLKARGKIPGVTAAPTIDVTVTHSTSTDYFQYTNCLDDAFHSAVVTLNVRLAKWNIAQVKDWVSAQDLVFANCNGGDPPGIPPPATDPPLQPDRAYQIAAAYFYGGKLDEAETRFRQIAADSASPWSDLSAYLIARVQIRRSTLQKDAGAMVKAQAQLQGVLGDAKRKAVQAQARTLLEFVRSRLDPPGRLAELGQVLIKPDTTLTRDLTDYRFLFDKLESGTAPPAKDELTDWLQTFHNKNSDHALAVWRAKHALPWLLASVVSIQPGDAQAADAVKAAEEVHSDSPAYLTAAFHSIRLRIDSNPQQARARLDELLKDAKLSLSDKNLFLAERMKAAANGAEFLKYAQRVPVDELSEADIASFKKGRTTLDADGAYVLNQRSPLKFMASAATDNTVSPALRTNLAMAAWARAILLGDEAIAEQMTPLLPMLSGYAAEKDKNGRMFAAALLMLKNPGLHPYADTGFGRETELNKIDEYRDNWWCATGPKNETGLYADFYKNRADLGQLKLLYPNSAPQAAFLSAADRSIGDAEWQKLGVLPAAPTYLSAAVVFYAQLHLDDPRVPEALALAVRSTRYGCTDAGTGKVSRQAYDLLHAKFPKSDAAARTRFWYK
jgi:hypothetical protein